jgi:hypothetical protein
MGLPNLMKRERVFERVLLLIPTCAVIWVASNWPSHGGEYGNRYLIPCWLFFSFLFAEILTHLKNRRLQKWIIAISIGFLFYSLIALSLFKSNKDTLTLQIAPSLYVSANDFVNHHFVQNVWKETLASPLLPIMTFGSSLGGYFVQSVLRQAGLLPYFIEEKAILYFRAHPPPGGGSYWIFFFIMMFLVGGAISLCSLYKARRLS